jgi:hypothetical protein
MLAVAGLAMATLRKRWTSRVALLCFLMLAGLASAALVRLPGYDGELMSRFLAPLAILGAGFCGLAVGELGRIRRGLGVSAVAIVMALQLGPFADAFFWNLNARWHAYDEPRLRHEVRALPADKPIVWLNTDVALPAAFLEGAYRHRSYPAAAIGDPETLAQMLGDAGGDVILAGGPDQRLNSLAATGSRALEPRFYGWSFRDFREVEFTSDAPFSAAFVKLDSDGALTVRTDDASPDCRAGLGAPNGAGWRAISLAGCSGAQRLVLASPCAKRCEDMRLLGFQVTPPADHRLWPWFSGAVSVIARPRADGAAAQTVGFSLASFLAANGVSALLPHMKDARLISDDSGVVWLRARLVAERS